MHTMSRIMITLETTVFKNQDLALVSYPSSQHNCYSSFILAQQSTFYSLDAIRGKPTSSSWNSPSPKGSQDQVDQPELSRHSLQAVYRKCIVSLLYSVSIKGNSTEDFLQGVMQPTHIHKLLSSIHSNKL